jgi:endonuclease III
MISFKLPSIYNYHSSLSFVYICHDPTPELWDPSKNLFLFPVENKPVAVLFEGRKAHIMADMDQGKAKWYVSSKLNLDPSGIRATSDGLSIAKELGLLQRYPHIRGFLPPKLGLPPRWLYTSLVKTVILQMVSYKVANIMISRFVQAFGTPIIFENAKIFTFPKPEVICETPAEIIKEKARISSSKAKAIKEVAKLEVEGKLKEMEDSVSEAPHDVAEELMKIRGVGLWTAYVSLMAGMGAWHAQPVDRLMRLLEKSGVKCDASLFSKKPHVAGYISVAMLFGEEALRERYFKLQG